MFRQLHGLLEVELSMSRSAYDTRTSTEVHEQKSSTFPLKTTSMRRISMRRIPRAAELAQATARSSCRHQANPASGVALHGHLKARLPPSSVAVIFSTFADSGGLLSLADSSC